MPELAVFYQSNFSYDFYIALAYGSATFIFAVLSSSIVMKWRSLKKKCMSLGNEN